MQVMLDKAKMQSAGRVMLWAVWGEGKKGRTHGIGPEAAATFSS